jgi:hypothetical protein
MSLIGTEQTQFAEKAHAGGFSTSLKEHTNIRFGS